MQRCPICFDLIENIRVRELACERHVDRSAEQLLQRAGLFSFMLSYGEFLFGLFITTTRERRTLPVVLGALSANTDVSWNMVMAAITLGTIPTLLLAFPVWRFMVRGLTSGAVRG